MEHIVISRKWNNPEISIDLISVGDSTKDGIEIKITLENFIESLVQEARNPLMVNSKKALLNNLKDAAEVVCSGLKEETAKVL